MRRVLVAVFPGVLVAAVVATVAWASSDSVTVRVPEFAVIQKTGASAVLVADSGVSIVASSCTGSAPNEQCTAQLDFGHSLANCGVTGGAVEVSTFTPALTDVHVDGNGYAVFKVRGQSGAYDPVRIIVAC